MRRRKLGVEKSNTKDGEDVAEAGNQLAQSFILFCF